MSWILKNNCCESCGKRIRENKETKPHETIVSKMISAAISNSCFYELPPGQEQLALEIIKIENQNYLCQCKANNLMKLVNSFTQCPYWFSFLIVKCNVNILYKNQKGENIFDVMAKAYKFFRHTTGFNEKRFFEQVSFE